MKEKTAHETLYDLYKAVLDAERQLSLNKLAFKDFERQYKEEEESGNTLVAFIRMTIAEELVKMRDNHGVVLPYEFDSHKLSLRKVTGGKVVVGEKAHLPNRYKITYAQMVEKEKINSALLKEDLDRGIKVKGAYISKDRYSLQILATYPKVRG